MKFLIPLALFLLTASCLLAQKSKTQPKSPAEYAEYGGKRSTGFAVGGGIGLPLRWYLNQQNVFEIGPYLSGVRIKDNYGGQEKFQPGFMVGTGFTFYVPPYFQTITRQSVTNVKLRKQGFGIRYNYLLGDYSFSRTTVGFVQETIKDSSKQRSVVFELGIAIIKLHSALLTDVRPIGLHFRLNWNGMLQKA